MLGRCEMPCPCGEPIFLDDSCPASLQSNHAGPQSCFLQDPGHWRGGRAGGGICAGSWASTPRLPPKKEHARVSQPAYPPPLTPEAASAASLLCFGRSNTTCTFAFYREVLWGGSQEVLCYLPPCSPQSGDTHRGKHRNGLGSREDLGAAGRGHLRKQPLGSCP